jgi:tetratricopeptide (TPR) repeat protein
MATSPALRPRRLPIRPRPLGILLAAILVAAASLVSNLAGLGTHRASTQGAAAAALAGPAAAGIGTTTQDPAGVGIPGTGGAYPAVGSLAELDHNIGLWTRNLRANPRDFLSATNLAILYHARARLTADLADHQRALEAARTAIRIAPTEDEARALEAAILYSLHDFHGAYAAANALYHDNAGELGALATRADASIELGQLSAARADLATLKAAAPGPATDIRLARLAFVTGDIEGAVQLARRARDAAVAEGTDPGFYEYALAEYERNAGDAAAAGAGYRAALAIRASDLGALLGLARIQAFDGRLDDAIATLRSATAIAPTPEAEGLLGDLLTERHGADDAAAAAAAFGTVRLTRTLSALSGAVYDRILVKFDLDHGSATPASVDDARAGLADRTDAGAYDLLGWALHREGRDAEAWTAIQAALATGAADARTEFHAGAIAASRGDDPTARRLLAAALALGPALDPIERAEASRVLGALGPAPSPHG